MADAMGVVKPVSNDGTSLGHCDIPHQQLSPRLDVVRSIRNLLFLGSAFFGLQHLSWKKQYAIDQFSESAF
jgi:hypothetical protein